MDSLIVGSHTGVRLELSPVRRPYAEGRGQLPSWRAHLIGTGLDATVLFSEEGWQEAFLAGFLSALAPLWRGGDGERIWRSAEGELGLVATHNGTNAIHIAAHLGHGLPRAWSVNAELLVEPGVELDAIAAEARRLSDFALGL
jgi:hypothetical protein